MSDSDSYLVFWAGYRKGKSDALDGEKSNPAPPENIAHRWDIDYRIGYAEGYHDGGVLRGAKKTGEQS